MGFDAKKYAEDIEKRLLSDPDSVSKMEMWTLVLIYKWGLIDKNGSET